MVFYLRYVVLPSSLCCDLDNQILKSAKGDSTSYDAIIEFLECFEHFLDHLKVLTEIPSAMGELLAKIIVEILGVLALATQQINRGRFSEFVVVYTFQSANMPQINLRKVYLQKTMFKQCCRD